MKFRRGWTRFMRFWHADAARKVDDELHFHFAQKIAEFEALGLSHADARARAEEEFGDIHLVKSSLREIDERVELKRRRGQPLAPRLLTQVSTLFPAN